MKQGLAIILAAMACSFLSGSFLPGVAHAKPARDGAGTASSVNLMLMGSITASCSIGGGSTIALGELSGGREAVARFDLGCNVPFELVLRSASGGIAHHRQPDGVGPYAGTLLYRLGIVVPALAPEPTSLRASFSSADLAGGGVMSSGEAIAFGGGELQLRTEMPAGRELLAGQYADSLTITINPRM